MIPSLDKVVTGWVPSPVSHPSRVGAAWTCPPWSAIARFSDWPNQSPGSDGHITGPNPGLILVLDPTRGGDESFETNDDAPPEY